MRTRIAGSLFLVLLSACRGPHIDLLFTFTGDNGEEAVPVNVDDETLGRTGEHIAVSQADHEVTFGDLGNLTEVGGRMLPTIETASGQHWVHDPVLVAFDPDDPTTSVVEEAITGSLLVPAAGWTCQDQEKIETFAQVVSYPNGSTLNMPRFGDLAISGLLLTRADNGTSEVHGNFIVDGNTGLATILINEIMSDGVTVGICDCWPGELADRPWGD